MSGIRTIDDLRDRCRIDEFTGCWLWAGAKSLQGQPSTRLSALKGRTVSLGTAVAVLLTGEAPVPGVIWHITCKTIGCGNPEHRKKGNRKSQMKAANMSKTLLCRAKISATKRAQSTKCSDEIAASIRESSEPLRVVAERTGLAISTCSHIRRFEQWKPAGMSVFSGLGSL